MGVGAREFAREGPEASEKTVSRNDEAVKMLASEASEAAIYASVD